MISPTASVGHWPRWGARVATAAGRCAGTPTTSWPAAARTRGAALEADTAAWEVVVKVAANAMPTCRTSLAARGGVRQAAAVAAVAASAAADPPHRSPPLAAAAAPIAPHG